MNYLSVPCDVCGAGIGAPCVWEGKPWLSEFCHPERIEAAGAGDTVIPKEMIDRAAEALI